MSDHERPEQRLWLPGRSSKSREEIKTRYQDIKVNSELNDHIFVIADKEFNSPYFLDCCGLVRRAMRDLKKDFGFRIGPWNQAYMYDTLPITIKYEDVKPGDLVFISAIYYSAKSEFLNECVTVLEGCAVKPL